MVDMWEAGALVVQEGKYGQVRECDNQSGCL
jgi:hypothetical protein